MTASPRSRVLVLALTAFVGCRTPMVSPLLLADPLEPLAVSNTPVPGPEDLAAARLAAAALASNPAEMELALYALRRAEAVQAKRPAADDSDLLPLALDLVNATLQDPKAYRAASKQLLEDEEEDQALRRRLKEAVKDDPLKIARSRILDARKKIVARTLNAISEPLGRSLITGVGIAPFALANSIVHWLAMLYSQDPISLQGRQALVQKQRFIEKHPGSRLAAEVARSMEGAQRRLKRTHRNELVRGAKQALAKNRLRLAKVLAGGALVYAPDDRTAKQLQGKALARIEEQRALRLASTGASNAALPELSPEIQASALDLSRALLLEDSPLETKARTLLAAGPDGALRDEAEFAIAIAEFEAGFESNSWGRLTALAYEDPRDSNMARHATALLANPWQDVHGAFVRMRRHQRGQLAFWKLLGRWSVGARYQRLPTPVAYLIDLPTVAQTLVTSPIRLLTSAFKGERDFQRPSSVLAYRYLERHPGGEYETELIQWLFDYEESEENWVAALRLSDFIDGFDPQERRDLVEHAAAQQLTAANRARRRDMRGSVLRSVAREYPDTQAGQVAGEQVREELEHASAQHIRMTREFLEENPRISGPQGLGLRPLLRDGIDSNGELHPLGVTFLGGREIELAFLAESGDEDDPPVKIRRMISAQRLARVAALLEETVLHNSQIDPDDRVGADARRDYFFERARLGLAETPDTRATAESNFVYRSMRERYGVVRARDGILPFDLVVQGNLSDFSIGAFPRFREPKETPDAFLYR